MPETSSLLRRRWPGSFIAPALALGLVAAGCGLDREGLGAAGGDDGGAVGDDAAAQDDGPSADTGLEVGPHGTPHDAGPGACGGSLPTGWTPVFYEAARAACPVGSGAAHDVVTGPAAAAGACTCTCAITATPSCAIGPFQSSAGLSSCNYALPALQLSGSGCTPLPKTAPLPPYVAGSALGPSGGACSATPKGDPAQLTVTQARTCDVPPAGDGGCPTSAPAGFSMCVSAPGDVGCPSGTPFTRKVSVADAATLVCSACGTCTVSATCSAAAVQLFADTGCTSSLGTFAADGVCRATGGGGGNLAALEYTAQVTPSCAGSGTTSSVQTTGVATVCCR